MYLGIHQMIVMGITILSLGIEIQRHGTPKDGNNNAWIHVIANILMYTLLWWGGFFRVQS